MNNMKIPA